MSESSKPETFGDYVLAGGLLIIFAGLVLAGFNISVGAFVYAWTGLPASETYGALQVFAAAVGLAAFGGTLAGIGGVLVKEGK